MANILKQAWWTLLLRGIAAILFALLLLFAPGMTLATGALSFVLLFGLYALIEGIAMIAGAVLRREGQWVLLMLLGIISLIAGLAALGNPLIFAVISLRVMILIVSFKAIAGGVMEMIAAWQLRREIDNEWLLMLSGVFSILFGFILLARPIATLEVLLIFAAFSLLISGVMQTILAFKVRGWGGEIAQRQGVAQV
jgi:uncharacterized membrane protein HdeD (DUF308 family)